jgi:hypothetical protein
MHKYAIQNVKNVRRRCNVCTEFKNTKWVSIFLYIIEISSHSSEGISLSSSKFSMCTIGNWRFIELPGSRLIKEKTKWGRGVRGFKLSGYLSLAQPSSENKNLPRIERNLRGDRISNISKTSRWKHVGYILLITSIIYKKGLHKKKFTGAEQCNFKCNLW